jgi:HEAT repeat protein
MRKSDMTKLTFIILLAALSGGVAEASQASSKTYQETRKLLSAMKDYDLYPERLAAVFRVGDARVGDLVQALDDPDKEVSLNAQRVIRYLGNEVGLKGLAEYYKKPRKEYVSSGPIPVPLIEYDFDFIKSHPSDVGAEHIYALALEDSARATELLASIARSNVNASAGSLIAQVLTSIKSGNPNKLLTGNTDLAALVLEHAFFVGELDKKYASARLVELNGAKDKSVLEVYINRGVLAEEWWHVVISKHENGWRFFSITQVGDS